MNDICDIICHLIFHADTHTLIDLTDLSGYYIRILLFNEELPNHWGGGGSQCHVTQKCLGRGSGQNMKSKSDVKIPSTRKL